MIGAPIAAGRGRMARLSALVASLGLEHIVQALHGSSRSRRDRPREPFEVFESLPGQFRPAGGQFTQAVERVLKSGLVFAAMRGPARCNNTGKLFGCTARICSISR